MLFSEIVPSLSEDFIAFGYQRYRLVSFIKFIFSNFYLEIKLTDLLLSARSSKQCLVRLLAAPVVEEEGKCWFGRIRIVS